MIDKRTLLKDTPVSPEKPGVPSHSGIWLVGGGASATLLMNVKVQERTGRPPQLERESQAAPALGRNQFCELW